MYVITSGKETTHFMDAESTVQMWENCYKYAFSQRRHSLGMTRAGNRGALLYDAFTGNEAMGGASVRRELFKTENNIECFQLDGRASVHGAPCDANHAYWRRLTDHTESFRYGFCADLHVLELV